MEYEYDPAVEPSYKLSFLKSFKRQIDDCYFNFIIVDAIFDKTEYMDEFWSYAKSKGFQVSALLKSICAASSFLQNVFNLGKSKGRVTNETLPF